MCPRHTGIHCVTTTVCVKRSLAPLLSIIIAERGGDADVSSAALFGLPPPRALPPPLPLPCATTPRTPSHFAALAPRPRCRLPCRASVAMGADGRGQSQSRLCKNRRNLKLIWNCQMAQAGVEEGGQQRKLFTITKFTGDPDCLSSNRGA